MKDYTGYKNNGCEFLEEIEPACYKYENRVVKLRRAKWKCKCGNIFISNISHIISGHSSSCGCEQRELASKLFTKHGCTKNGERLKIYRCYLCIKKRCFYKKDRNYKNYGGRGIQMYQPWRNSFEIFYEWFKKEFGLYDIPNNLSIDRIDSNGNYEPGNIRLATSYEQNNNRRNNVVFIINEKKETLANLARQHNINYSTLKSRIYKYNLTIIESLNKPVKRQKRIASDPNPI